MLVTHRGAKSEMSVGVIDISIAKRLPGEIAILPRVFVFLTPGVIPSERISRDVLEQLKLSFILLLRIRVDKSTLASEFLH